MSIDLRLDLILYNKNNFRNKDIYLQSIELDYVYNFVKKILFHRVKRVKIKSSYIKGVTYYE